MSHYDYLNEHAVSFHRRVCAGENIPCAEPLYEGLFSAHGDKCYSYREMWEEAHIPFGRGVAIYLLSRIHPWSYEVRDTPDGWVNPGDWVMQNYARFAPYFED